MEVSARTRDILSYDSAIWATADILRGSVTTKEHLYPGFMMPFFVLRMIESRLVRQYDTAKRDPELTSEEDIQEEIKNNCSFYNSMIIEGKTLLSTIVRNDKHFDTYFDEYLASFDPEVQALLGIVNGSDTENLNIAGKIALLRDKDSLLSWVRAWSEIDFTPYDNSEITTLEEQIKRRWADMSAETAGQQYTPSDIIDLITDLISVSEFDRDGIVKVYDMTCGGGNMLFGVEDKLQTVGSNIRVATYGQEMEGSLYALAKIESMFRKESYIAQGNTLVVDKFPEERFDFIVANPPYGVDWKEFRKAVENDQTGRFDAGKPTVADGQMLFIQHALAKLNETGKAFIVLNGSPMFSGDAGSGESNIRKWILDNDYLECIIQLPTDEFFNTGIQTYIWCLNKAKCPARSGRILCINAEDRFDKLKKNKGSKNKQLSYLGRTEIALTYNSFEESAVAKIVDRNAFYYNRQSFLRVEQDHLGMAFGAMSGYQPLAFTATSVKLSCRKNGDRRLLLPPDSMSDLKEVVETAKPILRSIDHECDIVTVTDADGSSFTLEKDGQIVRTSNGVAESMGCGEIRIEAKYRKGTKSKSESVEVSVSVQPRWVKDDEVIPYSPDAKENERLIRSFLLRWVATNDEEIKIKDNTVGVEINFNTLFPKQRQLRSVEEIVRDLMALGEASIAMMIGDKS